MPGNMILKNNPPKGIISVPATPFDVYRSFTPATGNSTVNPTTAAMDTTHLERCVHKLREDVQALRKHIQIENTSARKDLNKRLATLQDDMVELHLKPALAQERLRLERGTVGQKIEKLGELLDDHRGVTQNIAKQTTKEIESWQTRFAKLQEGIECFKKDFTDEYVTHNYLNRIFSAEKVDAKIAVLERELTTIRQHWESYHEGSYLQRDKAILDAIGTPKEFNDLVARVGILNKSFGTSGPVTKNIALAAATKTELDQINGHVVELMGKVEKQQRKMGVFEEKLIDGLAEVRQSVKVVDEKYISRYTQLETKIDELEFRIQKQVETLQQLGLEIFHEPEHGNHGPPPGGVKYRLNPLEEGLQDIMKKQKEDMEGMVSKIQQEGETREKARETHWQKIVELEEKKLELFKKTAHLERRTQETQDYIINVEDRVRATIKEESTQLENQLSVLDKSYL